MPIRQGLQYQSLEFMSLNSVPMQTYTAGLDKHTILHRLCKVGVILRLRMLLQKYLFGLPNILFDIFRIQ